MAPNTSSQPDSRCDFTIRGARFRDVPEITRLNAQLGYPDSAEMVAFRFRRIVRDRRKHRVFVAVADTAVANTASAATERSPGPRSSRRVIGWIHVFFDKLLTAGPQAEIGGFVVHESWRRRGVGAVLLWTAEQWARGRGISPMVIHTNVVRTEAHAFYEKCGYQLLKQSKVYIKEIR